MSCLGGSLGVEYGPTDPVRPEGSSRANGRLKSYNVEVITKPKITCSDSIQNGNSSTGGADGIGLSSSITASTQAIRGGGARGVGEDLRGVADRAGGPSPPNTDVVVLTGQMVLGGRH